MAMIMDAKSNPAARSRESLPALLLPRRLCHNRRPHVIRARCAKGNRIMELGLKGKVAVVTGGTEGIGKATVERLVAEGAKVALCARRAELIDAFVAELKKKGGDVFGMVADAAKEAELENFIEAAVKHFGRLDILVNNAGGTGQDPFDKVLDPAWKLDIEIKVMAHVRTTRAALPHMKKAGGGRIINLNMVGAKQPGAAMFPTTVSRAAGLALAKGLSKELAPHNILVNVVAVGKIKSMQQARRAAKTGKTVEQHYADTGKTVPMGRVGESEEVANVIAFLASDAASYVTGCCINVDGGLSGVL
jgi:NAD(P)-dependent dehydrogenase (short-subunit alcohol dehydrogenase family)